MKISFNVIHEAARITLPPAYHNLIQKITPWSDSILAHAEGGGLFAPKVDPSYTKWAHTAWLTFRLYERLESLGLFTRYPILLRPIQGISGVVVIANLYLLATHLAVEDGQKKDSLGKLKNNPYWRFTPLVLSMGTVVAAVFDFHKKPLESSILIATPLINRCVLPLIQATVITKVTAHIGSVLLVPIKYAQGTHPGYLAIQCACNNLGAFHFPGGE